MLLLPIFFPILAGLLLLVMKEPAKRNTLLWISGIALALTAMFTVICVFTGEQSEMILFHLTDVLPVYFKLDRVGCVFALLTALIWSLAGFYAFEYMKHEAHNKRFFGFYLILFGVLLALDFSGNLITFYLFFETMTLTSLPLVLHNQSHEAVMAGLKYLFYSMAGAYMALFGLYVLYKYGSTLSFIPGGVLTSEAIQEQGSLLLVAAFLMILGFGVKAGLFPMHAWLPTAHPVAPAPASAVLSAILVKEGILAIIRVVYDLFGIAFLQGTWVQYTWMILALITVFMGSMLAYREKGLKKRLAYSTVSQLSYIHFGLALMNKVAFTGALLHVVAHGLVKVVLFLVAGAIIYKTGRTKVDELKGIGKEMPITIWCWTFVSLGLIGIPPTAGFISKWYLATGSLSSGIGFLDWFGPVVLLVSALLTAGYLLPITMNGFFPGSDYDYAALQCKEPSRWMVVPMLVLTVLSVLAGMMPNLLLEYFAPVVSALF